MALSQLSRYVANPVKWRPSEQLRHKIKQRNCPHLNALISERPMTRRVVEAPKPATPPPEGQCWIFDSLSNEWLTRPRKMLKKTNAPVESPVNRSINTSSRALGGLLTPPDSPLPPLPTSKPTTVSTTRPKAIASALFHNAPLVRHNAGPKPLPKSDNGLSRVKGSRINKVARQLFNEKVRHAGWRSGRGGAVFTDGKCQVKELYEAKREYGGDGLRKRLRRQQRKEELEKEIDDLFN